MDHSVHGYSSSATSEMLPVNTVTLSKGIFDSGCREIADNAAIPLPLVLPGT